MRALLGIMLGVVARLWLATLRMHLVVHPDLARHDGVPWVLSFFHGTQWPLLAWRRRRPTLVMVSYSADGSMQARALAVLGFAVVRGSSSRGGARALAEIVRRMRRGPVDAAFAVDGPRGPYGEVKPGAALAAARSGGILVPMGSAVAHGRTFARAWDRFVLAWPFSRVVVVLGAPVEVGAAGAGVLQNAIVQANAIAEQILAAAPRKTLELQLLSGALDASQPVISVTSPARPEASDHVLDPVLERD